MVAAGAANLKAFGIERAANPWADIAVSGTWRLTWAARQTFTEDERALAAPTSRA